MNDDPSSRLDSLPRIKIGRTSVFRWLTIALFLLSSACSFNRPQFTVERLPQYETLFQRSHDWEGGDGIFSVPLDSNRILWLFGDSLIGKAKDGRLRDTALVNNTVALQTGKEPASATIHFFHGYTVEGKPAAFVQPSNGVGWFWPYHGVRTKTGLFLFMIQVERTDGPPAFDFRPVATWLVAVSNPDDPPDQWVFLERKIPWSHEHRLFGSSVLFKDDECFIFGTVYETSLGVLRKQLILVKVPLTDLMDFSRWRFYADGEWVTDVDRAESLCDNVPNEFSVSFQPKINRYLLFYTQDSFSDYIVFRSAVKPYGPWSEPVRVYQCPEAEWDPLIFCYAAKGHPELSPTSDELLVTYTTNAMDFSLIESDSRLYWPRFLRVHFQDP